MSKSGGHGKNKHEIQSGKRNSKRRREAAATAFPTSRACAHTHTHALNRQKRKRGGLDLALCFQPTACKTTQKPQQTCASALSVYFVTSQGADSKSRVTQSGFPSSLSGLFSILETPTAVLLFKKNTDEVIFFFLFRHHRGP